MDASSATAAGPPPLAPAHRPPLTARGLWALGTAALCALGLGRAWALTWVCDDSFISFRYADNLVRGLGLVYNAGERVEGYSNLLWTLLVAVAVRAGADPVRASQAMGMASYLALALVLGGWAARRARRGDAPLLPLAAAAVLVAHDYHVWATGGLETMLFALLGVAAILLSRADPRPARDWGVGALLALLVVLRPDGLLYAPAALLSLALPNGVPGSTGSSERPLRPVLRAAAPLVLVLVALVTWKLGYYGELLPTAFYSKSAARPYLGQGLLYVGLYLAKSWYLLPALLLLPWLARRTATRLGMAAVSHADPPAAAEVAAAAPVSDGGEVTASARPAVAADPERLDRRVLLATAALLTAYVVWSGGDFMFARRLVPIAPLVLVALESWLLRLYPARLRWILAAAVLAGAALPVPIFGEGRWRIAGIADEPHFYPPEAVATRRRQGQLLGELLRDTPARVMFEGGMCMFGYYSRLPYLVEMTGLTQYSLARLPLLERGVIGHEKRPDDRWLDEHEIHLIVAHEWPVVPPQPGARRHDDVYFGTHARAQIWLYSDAVMDALRGRPEVSFVPIEQVVAQLRAEMLASPYPRAAAAYDYLDHYYLRAAGERGRAIAAELQSLLEDKLRGDAGSGDRR